jgi:hypothetical protein
MTFPCQEIFLKQKRKENTRDCSFFKRDRGSSWTNLFLLGVWDQSSPWLLAIFSPECFGFVCLIGYFRQAAGPKIGDEVVASQYKCK